MIQDIDIGKMGFRVPGASTGLFLGGAIYTTLKILVPPNDHLLTALRESAEIWALLPLAFLVSLSAIKAYRGRLWKRNASHANDMAAYLATRLRKETNVAMSGPEPKVQVNRYIPPARISGD